MFKLKGLKYKRLHHHHLTCLYPVLRFLPPSGSNSKSSLFCCKHPKAHIPSKCKPAGGPEQQNSPFPQGTNTLFVS